MRDHQRCSRVCFTLAVWGLLVAGCTTGFDLRARPADASLDVGVEASMDVAADAQDAPPTDAGTCRLAGDRCCAEPTRGAFCVGGLVCSEGFCAPCPGMLFACGNACVDSQTNGRNCGACGTVCAEGQRCAGGSCVVECPAPGVLCGGRCANLASDDINCGACGRACAAPAANHTAGRCRAGACDRACEVGYGDCDGDASNGCEVDTRTTANHCGACGQICAPPRAAGVCTAGACAVASCRAGFANCDGNVANGCEVDTARDTSNCGACARPCTTRQVCQGGACVTSASACPDGFADCRADVANCETPTASDLSNCGACGRTCAFANATAMCLRGVCSRGACAAGFSDCDSSDANGCETRVASDVGNCGGCRRACTADNGVAACVAGACTVPTCNVGFSDCDGDPRNGCEVNTGSSLVSCGACARACAPANADPACVVGRCGIVACRRGFADCDGSTANGCEVDVNGDPVNCGACTRLCAFPNAAASCSGGACALGACALGFRNCDGAAANGCETNVSTSTASCGDCGRVCAFAHAAGACTNGVCALGACEPGWGNCDGNAGNGCETAITSSGANCGACGRGCATGQSCSGGVCVVACTSTEMVCAGGCVDLSSSVSHCGMCGNVCAAGANQQAICASGECRRRCVSPYGNCDNNDGNGCEVNLTVDRSHCGACGASCGAPPNATALCESGACVLACASGFRDCDGSAANGCEVSVNTDLANCARCGIACPLPSSARFHTTTSVCRAGACDFQCEAGWADCNHLDEDGCEASLYDVNHCGSCTTICPEERTSMPVCCRTNGTPICCRQVNLAILCVGAGTDVTCR